MTLYTDRLILRKWHEDDAEELYRYAKDPRIGLNTGWPPHYSIMYSKDIIKHVLSSPNTFAIVSRKSNKPVGNISLITNLKSNLDISYNEAEIGFWIGVPYWGQGLMFEALSEVLNFAFKRKNLDKIWAGYFDGNNQSKRVLEKSGFTYQYTKTVELKLLYTTKKEHVTNITQDKWLKKVENKE